VSWEGAVEPGARLHWQAQALGLGRAQNILALADGASWCWNLIQQRWPERHHAYLPSHYKKVTIYPAFPETVDAEEKLDTS
jgi:hypothetical protein